MKNRYLKWCLIKNDLNIEPSRTPMQFPLKCYEYYKFLFFVFYPTSSNYCSVGRLKPQVALGQNN